MKKANIPSATPMPSKTQDHFIASLFQSVFLGNVEKRCIIVHADRVGRAEAKEIVRSATIRRVRCFVENSTHVVATTDGKWEAGLDAQTLT